MNKPFKILLNQYLPIFSVILMVTLLLHPISEVLLAPNFFYDNCDWNNYKNLEEPVDVLIIGNSHARYGFWPTTIENLTSKNTTILATGALNLAWTYYGLKETLNYKVPEIIIIETFVYDVQYQNAAYTPVARTIYGNDIFKALPALIQLMDWQNIWYAYSPIIRYHGNWNMPLAEIGERIFAPIKEINTPRIDGFYNSSNIVSSENYLTFSQTLDPERNIPFSYPEYTKKILSLCADYNVPVIFVKSPTVDGYGIYDEVIANIIISSGGTFYDMNTSTSTSIPEFSRIQFMDAGGTPTNSHLNNIGALINSVSLAGIIANELNSPINQSESKIYDQLLLQRFNIHTTDDGEIKIILLTQTPSENLVFEYDLQKFNSIIAQSTPSHHNYWQINKSIYQSANILHFTVFHKAKPEIKLEGYFPLK